MPGRTAKFVSALFATVLAGIPLATISHGATPEAGDCLSGPKDQTPHGGHWYYRIDRATKRHCWYLKDENLPQNAAANSSPTSKPVSPNAQATTQRSIADAHAELPAQNAVEQPKGDALAPALSADAAIAAPAAEPQRSVVGSRWLEQSGAGSSAAPVSTADNSDAPPPPASEAMPSQTPTDTRLAAVNSAPENQPGSLLTLLLVILGALALAGLIGSAVFRFGNPRWSGRRKTPVDRRAIWETANIIPRSPLVDPGSGAHPQGRRPVGTADGG